MDMFNADLTGLSASIKNQIQANPLWSYANLVPYYLYSISSATSMTIELCIEICTTYGFAYTGLNCG